jgi:hypothetical protein
LVVGAVFASSPHPQSTSSAFSDAGGVIVDTRAAAFVGSVPAGASGWTVGVTDMMGPLSLGLVFGDGGGVKNGLRDGSSPGENDSELKMMGRDGPSPGERGSSGVELKDWDWDAEMLEAS